ncbi:PAS domain S-box protein [Singulisphaera sp. Ch08]|uniref:histidine kinase n=1 Tax=Singulisphaera sp. Ch08 TaxID=3120278 RepID=A0AAU7CID1_9BACT
MAADEDEDQLLRSVAWQNANAIHLARQRAEEDLIRANEALERKTEELARSLAMMRATLESTTDGILVTDGDGRVTSFNETYVAMWRIPREVIALGEHRPLLELSAQQFKDSQPFLARLDAIEATSPPESHDLLELADGRVFERSSQLQFVDNRNVGRVWSFRDITERRRTEEALQKQSEWLRVTLSSIGDAVIATDGWGRVTFLNRVAETLTGWSQADAIGLPLSDVFRIVNERSGQPVENPALRALREGTVVGLANHTILIAKDGSTRPIDDSAAPMRDGSGAMVGAVLVFRDVTARKRDEETRARLAAIVESSEDAIVSKDLFGRILSWNSGAERVFGYTAQEAVGSPITLIIPGNRRDEETFILERLRRGERVEHFETVRVTKQGRLIDISVTISPIYDDEGRVIAVSKVARDITARKRTEALLEGQKQVLELMAKGADLPEVLNALCRTVEGQSEEPAFASILQLTPDGRHLCHGAAPSLPESFNRAVDGIAIGPMVGSCGTAAFRGEPVYVTDIATDPLWADYAKLALVHGLRACWSFPIVSSGDELLGSFAVYFTRPRSPAPGDLELLGIMTRTAAIAIERKRAEAALRQRDERLQLFLGNATDYAILITDPEGQALEWQGGAEQITGWRAEEMFGKSTSVIFTPEDRAAGVPELEMAKAAQVGRAEDKRWHLKKDGSRFFADGVMVGLRGPAGELRGFGKVFRDATGQKRAEEDLKKQSLRLRLLWEAAAVLLTTEEPGTMLEDLFAKIAPHLELDTYFNTMVAEAGDALRLESCVGIPEEMAIAIARREIEQGLSATADPSRPILVMANTPLWPDDPTTTGLVKSCGLRAYAGNPLLADGRWLGTLSFASKTRGQFDEDEREFLRTLTHYVTVAYERLRLVRELQDADRKKDDFIAMLGHELRNPLAPVRNGLQIMRLAKGDSTAIEQARGMMDRQLGHMVRLIDDLLDVSRISRNKMELRRARVSLAEVIGNAMETARPAIEEAGHQLQVSLPTVPVFLDADLTRLAQVLSNLLTNSAKYTKRGGRIWLAAERLDDMAVISVRDNGIGVPPDDLPRIFDMFSQVDRSIERATGGLGIGLALVKGLVEMHGGTVTAESGGQGMGSTFTVRLPVLETAPALERPLESVHRQAFAASNGDDRSSAQDRRRRMLVVDDNQDSARTMARLLKLLGNEVQTAYDGNEAVATAEKFRPEVVLMDVGMPGLNGYEATRHIRQQPWGKHTVIIALTGWGQDIDRLQSKEAGCDGHLVKPVDLPDLETLLAKLADKDKTR